MSLRIGMVAGEPSGDLLAGRIIAGLQARAPGVHCAGIGGPQMAARGFEAWHPMHALTVFGYIDAFKRIPSLLSTYGDVKRRLLAEPPSVFVGIDAPDFNLRLEHQLRQAGTPPCISSVPRSGPGATNASTRSAPPSPTCWCCFRSRKRSIARKESRSPMSAIRWPG